MHITARHDYAVQAMLAIAAAGGRLVTTNGLAARQGIPATYLAPLLYDLRRAELLTSRPGNDGGYTLARAAERITVGDVMRAVSGDLSSIRGRPADSISYVGAARALPRFWQSVHSATGRLLDSTTLRDLLDQLPAPAADG
ncbi:Rrf2 family transcriptional regulator [Catellatospora sp. NPDC049609]|uniref:RrF2 family transcriptional regulator n=1 Tax=Catellatospora sp. NPDC049609 TaxID=3155505 RepID=UPI0034433189